MSLKRKRLIVPPEPPASTTVREVCPISEDPWRNRLSEIVALVVKSPLLEYVPLVSIRTKTRYRCRRCWSGSAGRNTESSHQLRSCLR